MFSNNRAFWRVCSLLSILVLTFVGARLFYLQVINYTFYKNMAEVQSHATVSIVRDRGIIFDRENRPLVQNHKVASLYVFGRNVEDPDGLIKTLRANGINIRHNLKETITNRRGFVWVERGIDITKARGLKELIPELDYHIEDGRFYPEGNMLLGILGFTNVDNDGIEGLEFYANALLTGQETIINTIRDSRGRLVLFDNSIMKTHPDSAVHLTINSQLQAIADRILKTDREASKAKRAIALAIDVRTGEILLSSVSEADSKTPNQNSRRNFATTYLFEPGSIFKAASFGFMIESGMYREYEVINTSRPVVLFDHNIRDVYPRPTHTHKEVFTRSSNIGTVLMMGRASQSDFHGFLSNAGFGRRLGLEAMAEEAGILRPPTQWSGLSRASISIGQEVMVSPMQMVRFYAAIANKGVAVKPNIIHKYESSGQITKPREESVRLFSESTAETLLGMMNATVESGTGRRARTGVLTVAGKTGTGQVIDRATGTYSTTEYVASFAGVFPAEDPRVAMIVIYESPRSSIYGGDTGASTFRKIAEQVAFFYNIGNDNTRVVYAD